MCIMQVLASQLHFLANRNAELAIPPLFWPVNCKKIGGHVALLSDPTVVAMAIQPRFVFKIISTIISQNSKFFFMHVLKKDVLLL